MADKEQENLKLRKKLKIVLKENQILEQTVRDQFRVLEEEVNRVRVVQKEIIDNGALLSGTGGGAGDVSEAGLLRQQLAASREREAALAAKLKARRDGGAGAAAADSDDEPSAPRAAATAGPAAGAPEGDLEAALAARTAELAKERDDAARKQAGLEEWVKRQIAAEQTARERERRELQQRIQELEALSEQDKDARENMLKKLKKTLQASGSADQVAAIKATQRKSVALRSEFEAIKQEAYAQRKLIAPEIQRFADAIRVKIEAEARRTDDAVEKYKVAVAARKKLYNKLQEMRGNIRVFCRTRPISADETASGQFLCATPHGEDEVLVIDPAHDNARKIFKFDRIYPPTTSQAEVFEDTRPLVTSVLDGYNVCIFAYGQTGSGKTYTMDGPAADPGINKRTLQELFRIAVEREEDYDVSITVSYLEIYNEAIYDLLAEPAKGGIHAVESRLDIRQDTNGRVFVPGLVDETCRSYEDVLAVIARGAGNRATFATDMNEHSSRSHSILQICVRCANKITHTATVGKLSLVDLAGSERLDRSGAVGERLKEATFINKSLSALGDVIQSLTAKDKTHIPFRNSKLTFLLADSLGGDSKTLMFVQVAPGSGNVAETLCSLNFAIRVRSVKLQLASVHTESPDVAAMKAQLAALQAQVAAGGARA